MKRMLALVLSVCLLCAMAVPAVYADYSENKSVLTAEKTALLPGQTFTVTVELTNTATVRLGAVALFYDEAVFEMLGGECLISDTMTNAIDVEKQGGTFLFREATVVSGDIFSFQLKVKEEAPLGAAEITQRTSIAMDGSNYIAAEGLTLQIVTCAEHTFDQKVVAEEYKATAATFTDPATYYYSCQCGAKGDTTFTEGAPLTKPDTYSELIVENAAPFRGQTFTVTAKLTNTGAIRLGTVALFFDEEIFELVSGKCLVPGAMMGVVDPETCAGTFLFQEATVVSGDIFSFQLKVKEDAPLGVSMLSQRTAIGVDTGSYITAAGVKLDVSCDHIYGPWTAEGENHTAVCSLCGDVKTQPHTFDQQLCTEAHLATPATCTSAATYYYSCTCGAIGAETFQVGEPSDHEYQNGVCIHCQLRLGDIDGNGTINTEDVVKLLLYISMPDLFPVGNAVVDFDGDDAATTEDAVKLLLYISMPDLFPL